ncbi:hypothetical protein [Amycolatopsis sp. cmx-11-51]
MPADPYPAAGGLAQIDDGLRDGGHAQVLGDGNVLEPHCQPESSQPR